MEELDELPQDLKDKLEDVIEEKVEERVREELGRRQGADSDGEEEYSEDEGISRRGFLKKVGIGAAGLGALSLTPASALNMRSNDFTFYGDDSTPEFQIEDGGPVKVENSDLEVVNQDGGDLRISGELTEGANL